MFVEYDTKISADRSVLNIPILATVLPLAWLTGSRVYVDELDRTFKESMDDLKQEFEKMYPEIPFARTKINAEVLKENQTGVPPSEGTALFFSGGVDSTYSLITNLELKPRLIMIWGLEGHPYPRYPEYWEKVISTYSKFAEEKDLKFNVIRTNALGLLHERRIEHDFHEKLYEGTLWGRLQHGLLMIPLSAPLSIGRFNTLLFAASREPTYKYSKFGPWATQPRTDEKIAWADLEVRHDGYIHLFDKMMGAIREHLKNNQLILRICPKKSTHINKELNCSKCVKCLERIGGLALAGVDPNACGFEVDSSTFKLMKSIFERKEAGTVQLIETNWKKLQNMIPNEIEHDFYGSKEFFEWFRNFDLKLSEYDVEIYRDIYNKLPFPIAKILDEFYKLININIHEHSPVLKSSDLERRYSNEKT